MFTAATPITNRTVCYTCKDVLNPEGCNLAQACNEHEVGVDPYENECGLHIGCPLLPSMEVMGSLMCMAWETSHGQSTPLPTELPTFFIGSLMSCQLLLYIKVVGSLMCITKFPWAANGQPNPLPTCSQRVAKWVAPLFFGMGSCVYYGLTRTRPIIRCRDT